MMELMYLFFFINITCSDDIMYCFLCDMCRFECYSTQRYDSFLYRKELLSLVFSSPFSSMFGFFNGLNLVLCEKVTLPFIVSYK